MANTPTHIASLDFPFISRDSEFNSACPKICEYFKQYENNTQYLLHGFKLINNAIQGYFKDESLKKLFTRGVIKSMLSVMTRYQSNKEIQKHGVEILLSLSKKSGLVEDLIGIGLPNGLIHLLDDQNHPFQEMTKEIFMNIHNVDNEWLKNCKELSKSHKRIILGEEEIVEPPIQRGVPYDFARITNDVNIDWSRTEESMLRAREKMLYARHSYMDHYNLLLIINYFKSKFTLTESSVEQDVNNDIEKANTCWEHLLHSQKEFSAQKAFTYDQFFDLYMIRRGFCNSFKNVFSNNDEKLKEDMDKLIRRIKNNKLLADQELEKKDVTKKRKENAEMNIESDDFEKTKYTHDNSDNDDNHDHRFPTTKDHEKDEEFQNNEEDDDEDNEPVGELLRKKRARSLSNPKDSSSNKESEDQIAKRTRHRSSATKKDLPASKGNSTKLGNKSNPNPPKRIGRKPKDLRNLFIFSEIETITLDPNYENISVLVKPNESLKIIKNDHEIMIKNTEENFLAKIKLMLDTYEQQIEELRKLQATLSISTHQMAEEATNIIKKLNENNKYIFTKKDLEKTIELNELIKNMNEKKEKIMTHHKDYLDAKQDISALQTSLQNIHDGFDELYDICATLPKEFQTLYNFSKLKDSIMNVFDMVVKNNYEKMFGDESE